jgi:hypothetical protein
MAGFDTYYNCKYKNSGNGGHLENIKDFPNCQARDLLDAKSCENICEGMGYYRD